VLTECGGDQGFAPWGADWPLRALTCDELSLK
jgi:hypothetical protein